MAYIGRVQIGELLTLLLNTRSASEIPSAPDDAPRVDIFDASDAKILSLDMPIDDATNYVFRLQVPLNSTFSTGTHRAVYRYKANGAVRLGVDYFQIVAGGGNQGAPIAMFPWPRPEANYIVMQTDNGKVYQGRNPSLTTSAGVF